MDNTIPQRRKPNTSLTEADWLAVMERFLAGETDSELALAYKVSTNTIQRQRNNRGVKRADRPGAAVGFARGRVAPLDLGEDGAPPEGGGAEGGGVPGDGAGGAKVEAGGSDGGSAPEPRLVPPKGDDAAETSKALLRYSRALVKAGHLGAASEVARTAKLLLSTERNLLDVVARVGGEGDEAGGAAADDRPDPPVLREAQRPPAGEDWRTWLFLGGRGAGKTLAGACWLARRAREVERLALVGPSVGDVREVMIEGPSGLRGLASALGPEGARPRYEPSRRRLLWPNGTVAHVFTAEDPDGLRGAQFAGAWADEVCAWPDAAGTLALLRMGLRLGEAPRLVLTTTPRPSAALAGLLAEPGLVVSRGSAAENAAFLAPGFLDELRALYGGTRLERQELDGEVLEAAEGALFRRQDMVDARRNWGLGGEPVPQRFDQLVVGVDPPAGIGGAACGIVVCGRAGARAWVLDDGTAYGLTPEGWAARVCYAAERAAGMGPVSVVAEANQGGEMVRTVLATAGLKRPLRLVHASVGKRARAEPVALLYQQGRVAHAPGLEPLEEQLLLLGSEGPSPDRADALVWALTALMLERRATPSIHAL